MGNRPGTSLTPHTLDIFQHFQFRQIILILILRTYKQIHSPTVEQRGGGGGGGTPSPDFLLCCSISKRFYLCWKAFDLLNKMRYIIWVMALLLVASDVTNNGRHLGFYQELEIRLKPRKIVFFVLYTINNKISTLYDFSHKVYFYCWRKL